MTQPSPSSDVSRPYVLIVDDERRNRQLIEVMLGEEGYELQTAESGLQAIEMVKERRPDLILLDVMMPGMNGYEVAASLKVDPVTRQIPIIILTALDDRSSRIHGLSAGAEEFLTKPVNRHELCLRVRNLLKLVEHQQRRASGLPDSDET
jgi:DNA-binding response OmpR family regulator